MSWSNRQSPSVTMSSPATSCSRRYTDNASTYCSRNRDVTIASRNDRVPRFSVYQLGRGNDPVIVVGSIFPAVAFNMTEESSLFVVGDIGQQGGSAFAMAQAREDPP